MECKNLKIIKKFIEPYMEQLATKYDPTEVEEKWYEYWIKNVPEADFLSCCERL